MTAPFESAPTDFNTEQAHLELAPIESAYSPEESSVAELYPQDIVDIVALREEIDVIFNDTRETPVAEQQDVEAMTTNDTLAPVIPLFKVMPVREPWSAKLGTKLEGIRSGQAYRTRPATLQDVEKLVDVDIRAFSGVYSNEERDSSVFRGELNEKFRGRILKHGGDWMQVLEREGDICGFINVCPTSKSPEVFESWEVTTDNGTLETTYDPDGKNLYIVSLSMLPGGTSELGQNMLFANQIGKMVEEGYEQAFFESRLPGLRTWMRAQCRATSTDFEGLSVEEQLAYANSYFQLKKTVNGKEVYHDRLLRIYAGVGCKFLRVVPDAYKDAPSMNFGAICIYENPLPKFLRQNVIARKVAGKAIRLASRSHRLMQKLF